MRRVAEKLGFQMAGNLKDTTIHASLNPQSARVALDPG
jgi:hypothetical protein